MTSAKIDTPARRGVLWRRWRRRVAGALIAVAALCTIIAVTGILLARSKPAWWHAIDLHDPHLSTTATALENGVVTVLSEARPTRAARDGETPWSDEWVASIKAEDVTAWLNAKMPRWAANQQAVIEAGGWPPQIAETQVAFEDGAVSISVRMKTPEGESIVSARVWPRVGPDGALWCPASTLWLGRLAIPASLVLSARGAEAKMTGRIVDASTHVPETLRELKITRQLAAALVGAIPAVKNASVRLQDGRRVRLLSVDARDGKLLLTCRTEGARPRKAGD